MYKRINYLGPRKTACCLMMDSSSRPHFCERSATSWLVSSMLLLAAGLCSGVRQGLVPPSSHSWTNYCLPPSVIQPLFN